VCAVLHVLGLTIFLFTVTVDASKEADADKAEAGGILSSTKLYIVIACIVALLLIALIQATCTIYKITRKPVQGSMSPKVRNSKNEC